MKCAHGRNPMYEHCASCQGELFASLIKGAQAAKTEPTVRTHGASA